MHALEHEKVNKNRRKYTNFYSRSKLPSNKTKSYQDFDNLKLQVFIENHFFEALLLSTDTLHYYIQLSYLLGSAIQFTLLIYSRELENIFSGPILTLSVPCGVNMISLNSRFWTVP